MQVWNNVSFADNYFQTIPNLNGNTLTLAGRDIPNLPDTENPNVKDAPPGLKLPRTGWPINPDQGGLLRVPNHSVRLGANTSDADNYQNSRAGFTKDISTIPSFFDATREVHGQVNSWYTGTADFDLTEFPDQIYRRRGDGYYEHLFDSDFYNLGLKPRFNPWYTPDFLPENDFNSFDLGEANAPWEGIGTGWFYSALGGGKDKRPESKIGRVPVEFDNTYDTRMRGDFAVPTLFNGNFDAVTKPDSRPLFDKVPGWSFHFDDEAEDAKDLTTDKLVEWSKIPNLDTYREQVGYNSKQPNYALKLDGGDKITHNNFVVPDWGDLTLDVYVPIPAKLNNQNDYIEVFLETDTQKYNLNGEAIINNLETQLPSDKLQPGEDNNSTLPAVDLREVHWLGAESQPTIQSQLNRIGYGTQGFETFNLNIPDEARGKNARIKVQINGSTTVFVDNVFFQSQHLRFGNPTDARSSDNPSNDNYLVEKPQYALSYNDELKIPNWVSYELNPSWVSGSGFRAPFFEQDFSLPFVDKVRRGEHQKKGINGNSGITGHLVPSQDRNRTFLSYYSKPNEDTGLPEKYIIAKDNNQTFLTDNAVTQPQFDLSWQGLEEDLNSFVKKPNNTRNEVHVLAGRLDSKDRIVSNTRFDSEGNPYTFNIDFPDLIWKVVLIPEYPGQAPQDITTDTVAFGVLMENKPQSSKEWKNSNESVIVSVNELEEYTGYDFFSNIPQSIQKDIENNRDVSIIDNVLSASLIADPNDNLHLSINEFESSFKFPVGHSSLTDIGIGTANASGLVFWQDDFGKINLEDKAVLKQSPRQISIKEVGFDQSSPSQVGISQISFPQAGTNKIGTSQIGIPQISQVHSRTKQVGSNHFSSAQINSIHNEGFQVNSTQDNITQIGSLKNSDTRISRKLNASEVSFSSGIALEQIVRGNVGHFNDIEIINVLNNSATNIWSNLIQSETELDIDFQITDLPKGQLAEATITDFDDSGIPTAGTILIDHDANSVGWFVDETPLDNSEFVAQDTDSYLLATAESEADGKYDLLTTVLHELSHLYGFIDGYEGFEDSLETENGTTKFIGNDFEATLDGEHLDKQAHPYDLLNTHLAPGMRKLPSELDVEILQALLKAENRGQKAEGLDAALTSDPLLAINNGDFAISDTTTDSFAWDTRGASGIEAGQAVLTEDSPFLSNFTQTFTVPEEAKTIQFKLIETELGASELAPPDAFEVALLDANTNESLVTDNDLSETDSLLNIQNDGTTYFSDKVRIGGAASGEIIDLDKSRTVTVDISDLTPGTEATLYFDLLGFSEIDSRVVIDDVRLSDQNLLPPTAVDDTATTTQGQPAIIDILANDTDDDGTIAPESVQIQTEPTNGAVRVNDDGTVTYTPSDRAIGTDSFTYVVQDNDGQLSEPASVSVEVENVAPEITEIQIPDDITEGDEITLNANATDAGNDELTYTWEFEDNTTSEGQSVVRTYVNNGTYTGTVTVTDTNGGSDTQDFEVVVANASPVADAGEDKTVDEGSAIAQQ